MRYDCKLSLWKFGFLEMLIKPLPSYGCFAEATLVNTGSANPMKPSWIYTVLHHVLHSTSYQVPLNQLVIIRRYGFLVYKSIGDGKVLSLNKKEINRLVTLGGKKGEYYREKRLI